MPDLLKRLGSWLRRGLLVTIVVLAPLPYLDLAGPLPPVQAGLPVVGVGALAAAAWLAWRRRLIPAVLALTSAALLTGPVLAPPWRPDSTTAQGSTLRLMSVNVEFGRADPTSLVQLADARDIDVLILTEVTPQGWQRFLAAGLGTRFPHATGRTDTGASGTVILTRGPFTCLDTVAGSPCGQVVTRAADASSYQVGGQPATFDLPSIRLGDGTVVRGIHARPPSFLRNDRWQREQHALREWVDAQPADTPVLLAGDFNASPSHPAFRKLASGIVRAPHVGFPWLRTWPYGAKFPPVVGIDHILARGFAVTDEGLDVIPGTDHAAVWAQLRRLHE